MADVKKIWKAKGRNCRNCFYLVNTYGGGCFHAFASGDQICRSGHTTKKEYKQGTTGYDMETKKYKEVCDG